ncbi:MAG: phosphotransferase family protein [Candidatus Hodarchaeales archaeon]|jgi:aminoglycoside 3'-phosphotransferase-2
MRITEELKQEVIDCLLPIFPSERDVTVGNFQHLLGADTDTFSFSYFSNDTDTPLILRIYRQISNRAEKEFNTLHALSTAGISVPVPYIWKKASLSVSRSFLIMEKIPGELLSDYLLNSKSERRRMTGFQQFIQELVNIHSYDWKSGFTDKFLLKIPDIENDPYDYINKLVNYPQRMINLHNINDLKPLIGWLKNNKVKTDKLSLLHGDYHMNNVIITPQKNLIVIDWADLKIGDFRHDLAFAILATSSAGLDVSDSFISLYQNISNFEVRDIEYYMILAILHNLLRCYSALHAPPLLGETETTEKMFFETYKSYTKYLTRIVKRITGINLTMLEEALFS